MHFFLLYFNTDVVKNNILIKFYDLLLLQNKKRNGNKTTMYEINKHKKLIREKIVTLNETTRVYAAF